MAAVLASLVSLCAAEAPDSASRRWYWEKAIEILDRAPEIGAERPPVAIEDARMRELEQIIARRERIEPGQAMTARTVDYLRALLTWTASAL